MVGAALGMDGAFQGVYVNHLGGGGLIVGLLFGVSAFSEFPSMRYAGDIARRLGGPSTLLLSYALLGAAYAGFALARDPLVLVPLAMVKGFGFGLYFVSTVRLVDERTPPEWASTIQAALNAGAGGLAPLAGQPARRRNLRCAGAGVGLRGLRLRAGAGDADDDRGDRARRVRAGQRRLPSAPTTDDRR